MKYKVILMASEEGYSISCPSLPGCWSQGESEEEALENIQDAIREYLAAREDYYRTFADQSVDVREVEIAL